MGVNVLYKNRRKYVAIAFLIILLILTLIQIIIDYSYEKKVNNDYVEVAKRASFCIFVEIEDKTLYLLQEGKCIKKYPIASGAKDTPSPLGFWKIVNKADWGEGFGGRWMEINVPWGAIFLEFHKNAY